MEPPSSSSSAARQQQQSGPEAHMTEARRHVKPDSPEVRIEACTAQRSPHRSAATLKIDGRRVRDGRARIACIWSPHCPSMSARAHAHTRRTHTRTCPRTHVYTSFSTRNSIHVYICLVFSSRLPALAVAGELPLGNTKRRRTVACL